MFVRSINIRRDGDYGASYHRIDPTKPLLATIQVEGQSGKVELVLSPDLSRRVVDIIAEEVAAAGRATAQAMTAEIFKVAALQVPDPVPVPAGDEMPF